MSLKGSAYRFIDSESISAGTPGGKLRVTFAAQPTGTYPALGEPIATLLAGLPQAKVPQGVRPSNAYVTDDLGHVWTFDASGGTMGNLRNFTAISNTPTEHATAAYDGNEASAVLTITLEFPLFGDMSR